MVAPRQVTAFLVVLLALKAHCMEKDRAVRQFNAGYDPSYSAGGSHALVEAKVKECHDQPEIDHARVRCAFSGCRVRCNKGYKLPTGRASTVVKCDHGTGDLMLESTPWQPALTPCLPQCGSQGCLNGGTCVTPNSCQCASGFKGNNCQEEGEQLPQDQPASFTTCKEPNFPMKHAEVDWSGQQKLTVECNAGYAFKIGGKHATILCRDGVWDVPSGVFQAGGQLDCQPECNPPCGNNGICLPGGVCDCPTSYWGPECQLQRCTYPRQGLSNSSLGGNLSRLKVECHPGRIMVTGRRWQTILCREGEWTVPGRGLLQDNDLNCYPEETKDAV